MKKNVAKKCFKKNVSKKCFKKMFQKWRDLAQLRMRNISKREKTDTCYEGNQGQATLSAWSKTFGVKREDDWRKKGFKEDRLLQYSQVLFAAHWIFFSACFRAKEMRWIKCFHAISVRVVQGTGYAGHSVGDTERARFYTKGCSLATTTFRRAWRLCVFAVQTGKWKQ